MPRFSILAHDHPVSHWDLFLESGDSLRSWRLLGPLEPRQAVPAESIGDHRLDYLDYEGPVSGGRGSVTGLDRGTFTWVADGPGHVCVQVLGNRYVGRVTLQCLAEGWTCRFDPESPLILVTAAGVERANRSTGQQSSEHRPSTQCD